MGTIGRDGGRTKFTLWLVQLECWYSTNELEGGGRLDAGELSWSCQSPSLSSSSPLERSTSFYSAEHEGSAATKVG